MGHDAVVVAGAGGFIGGHLVSDLLASGFAEVRAVDCKPLPEWYQLHPDAENLRLDLTEKLACFAACDGAAVVFNLAADMGGMGFIETHKADCMLSVLINTHMLLAARRGTRTRNAISLVPQLASTRPKGRQRRRSFRSKKATPIPPCPRTDMAGKSSSANVCAATSSKISVYRRVLCGTITFTVRTALIKAAERKRLPRSAER